MKKGISNTHRSALVHVVSTASVLSALALSGCAANILPESEALKVDFRGHYQVTGEGKTDGTCQAPTLSLPAKRAYYSINNRIDLGLQTTNVFECPDASSCEESTDNLRFAFVGMDVDGTAAAWNLTSMTFNNGVCAGPVMRRRMVKTASGVRITSTRHNLSFQSTEEECSSGTYVVPQANETNCTEIEVIEATRVPSA